MKPFRTMLLTAGAALILPAAAAFACPMHGGKIVDINPQSHRVLVTKGDDIATFRAMPDKTKITINGKQASFADLKPGDIVNVNYDMNEEITEVQVKRNT